VAGRLAVALAVLISGKFRASTVAKAMVGQGARRRREAFHHRARREHGEEISRAEHTESADSTTRSAALPPSAKLCRGLRRAGSDHGEGKAFVTQRRGGLTMKYKQDTESVPYAKLARA